jgi:glycosyltransferase involved in cell wall biosynthesis
MKVLQINSVCGIGSTGRIATDIHNILIEQGHVSYIAYGRDLPKNCDNAIRIGTKIDNYTHVAKTRLLDKHGFGSIQATKEFIDRIKDIDPDIIHLHNIHGYYINVEILFNYLKEANKPVVWTLHDCWSFTGHCSHFDYIGCNKWKTGCFNCPQKQEYPKSILIDNSEQNFNRKSEAFTGVENLTIVTPSNWLAQLVNESYLNDYRIEIIHNGIDLEVFKPTKSSFRKKYNLQNKFIILGVASTWTNRKGLEEFVKLSHELDKDEVIVLVGVTNYQIKQLPKNIIGIRRTNSIEELAKIYTAADVFINLTLEEVLGLTNIEALACGTPVVSYDTGGTIETLDSKCGTSVEKENFKKLLTKIKEVKDKCNIKQEKYCQESARRFDKNHLYSKYYELYLNLTS